MVLGAIDEETAVDFVSEAAPHPAAVTTLLGTDILGAFDSNGDNAITATPAGTDIEASFIAADISVCSGFVHIVDTVLVPARLYEGPDGGMYGESGAFGGN